MTGRKRRGRDLLIGALYVLAGLAMWAVFFCIYGDPAEMTPEEIDRANHQRNVCLAVAVPVGFNRGGRRHHAGRPQGEGASR